MLFVKLVRQNPIDGVYQQAMVAGPYEDDTDANYNAKQLRLADSNRDSTYTVVDCLWVVAVVRPNDKPEVVSWHETEDDCKANAAAMQRGDYSVVVEPKKYDDIK